MRTILTIAAMALCLSCPAQSVVQSTPDGGVLLSTYAEGRVVHQRVDLDDLAQGVRPWDQTQGSHYVARWTDVNGVTHEVRTRKDSSRSRREHVADVRALMREFPPRPEPPPVPDRGGSK